jgi:hypothetical protein
MATKFPVSHLRASVISKNFPGLYALTPVKQGRRGDGRGGRGDLSPQYLSEVSAYEAEGPLGPAMYLKDMSAT